MISSKGRERAEGCFKLVSYHSAIQIILVLLFKSVISSPFINNHHPPPPSEVTRVLSTVHAMTQDDDVTIADISDVIEQLIKINDNRPNQLEQVYQYLIYLNTGNSPGSP